jgi:hypothetical protein
MDNPSEKESFDLCNIYKLNGGGRYLASLV